MLRRLEGACAAVTTDDAALVEAARDWWPLSTVWAIGGEIPAVPAAVARPRSTEEVSAVVRVASEARLAVTPFAGMSGVCGGAVPSPGGLSIDMTGLDGVVDVDGDSLLVEVGAGTFGPDLEASLAGAGLTLGHWPQSVDLSTVGGWVACRGAGQYSTRYGKIEDMVTGLEVVLASGEVVRTGGRAPRSAAGPDLTQLFVGSEGTLGVITSVGLRVHPAPTATSRRAYGFETFAEGLDACRRILRSWATPAVLRLYDRTESGRQFQAPDTCVLIVVDEGQPETVDATMAVVAAESRSAQPLDEALATRWLEHRNNIPPVADLIRGGLVVDTVEIAARWSALPALYEGAVAAVQALPATLAVSAHESHAYIDGACLYFTFAGRAAGEAAEPYYRSAFDAIMSATLAVGGSISHHHGIGLNRASYMADELGTAFGVLRSLKTALDPQGILNPGKLGLA